jgi:hypothetical protein
MLRAAPVIVVQTHKCDASVTRVGMIGLQRRLSSADCHTLQVSDAVTGAAPSQVQLMLL